MEQNESISNKYKDKVVIGNLSDDFLRVGQNVSRQEHLDNLVAQSIHAQENTAVGHPPVQNTKRLRITVVEARLTKNYGLTKMDPYCRIRVGHMIFETPTCGNGAKNPKWNKSFNCPMSAGINSIYVEVYDERTVTTDEQIAFGYIQIPEDIRKGEVIDDWYPLSGKMGDGKEGMLNVIMSYVEVPQYIMPSYNTAPMMVMSDGRGFQPYMNNPYYLGAPPQVYLGSNHQAPQESHVSPHRRERPTISEKDFKQIKEMFPEMDDEVIKTVLYSNHGNKDVTVNALLQMNCET